MSEETSADGLRAVAYVRVSMEREDMISPQLQMKAVAEYCDLRGYRIVRVIEDLDLSGRFWTTRQVDQAIEMLEHDEADVVVVWRWSRVSRNRLDWAVALGRVDAAGGRLESASESFDTSTATGKFARGMLAEFAAFESDRIADVWREVRDRRVSLGLAPWGHEQFGYKRSGGGYVVDKKTGPILHELYRRYTDGQSFDTLSKWLARHRVRAANSTRTDTRWGAQTLRLTMDKGFGAGLITVGDESFPGAHEPILSQVEWDAFLARRQTTRQQPRIGPGDSLLAGLVQCSCGRAMGLRQGPPSPVSCVPGTKDIRSGAPGRSTRTG